MYTLTNVDTNNKMQVIEYVVWAITDYGENHDTSTDFMIDNFMDMALALTEVESVLKLAVKTLAKLNKNNY